MSEFKWYIIDPMVGFEKKVAQTIEFDAGRKNLQNCIEELIVPVETVEKYSAGKKIKVEKQILPGYILIKADLTDALWNMIKNIQYVGKLLGRFNKPMVVPQSEIDVVLRRIEEVQDQNQHRI